ncbi:MAG: hypothetical protein BMS9Abin34_067 [Patescibacteria group bacterium]|nr:MAG: hypothetical protein BMS9Abin34_067 [Patescibacteria group bacterium]
MLKRYFGRVRALLHQLSPTVRAKLNQISEGLLQDSGHKQVDRILVVVTGLSLSGKTTFVENHPKLKNFFRVETRNIHDRLNSSFHFLQDDNTVNGKAYWERQFLTQVVREKTLEKAMERGFPVVSDSCNSKQEKRSRWYSMAKRFGYRTMTLWIKCNKLTLLQRAWEADEESRARGEKGTWEKLILRQIRTYEPPLEDDANQVVAFWYDRMKPESAHQIFI